MKHDIDISQLSPAECMVLTEELWERARAHPEAIPAPPEQLEELYHRLDALDAGTMEPGEPWEVVRKGH
jgi:putative addiction module component (TIGR02574 family)